jgi:hypothetical protein
MAQNTEEARSLGIELMDEESREEAEVGDAVLQGDAKE